MDRTISEEWLASLPSQFRPERIIREELCFFEVDSFSELSSLPKCCVGSVAFVRGENPAMYMKSSTSWKLQTMQSSPVTEVSEDGS